MIICIVCPQPVDFMGIQSEKKKKKNAKEVFLMTITTNTTDRKAPAKAIAEELGTTAR